MSWGDSAKFGAGVWVVSGCQDHPDRYIAGRGLFWSGGGCGGGCWWLFENYTVDASIFVVKLLRAHGGCLGIRSR